MRFNYFRRSVSFPFSFQFFTRLAAVIEEEVGDLFHKKHSMNGFVLQ
jgi:hypothetical protein